MNIQTNGIFRCTDTVLVLQFACIVAHIGAQHLLYFQADAIHIAAIHSIIFDNYRLAILFPAEHTNKNKNLCRRIKRFNNSSPTMNFSFLIDFHSGEIAPKTRIKTRPNSIICKTYQVTRFNVDGLES